MFTSQSPYNMAAATAEADVQVVSSSSLLSEEDRQHLARIKLNKVPLADVSAVVDGDGGSGAMAQRARGASPRDAPHARSPGTLLGHVIRRALSSPPPLTPVTAERATEHQR